jgi:hypothetical protein
LEAVASMIALAPQLPRCAFVLFACAMHTHVMGVLIVAGWE